MASSDWRSLYGVSTAWFDAASLLESAALAGPITKVSDEILVDLRPTGVRVRLASVEHAEAVSAVARDLGLVADATALQELRLVFESPGPPSVGRFWEDALGYEPDVEGRLTDPLRRDPGIHVRRSADTRPLRNRIHLDVVRPGQEVEKLDVGEAFGPYGVCHTDPDGNEVDLVPGEALGDETPDWQAVFSAVACYRTSSVTQRNDLAGAAAALADEAGFPLLIDLRPGLVIFDSGKDLWAADAHGLDLDFTDLAQSIQTTARELGATVDRALPRFAQLFVDAADVAAVRAFWMAALGYVSDRREGLTDIVDPRRLNPVLVFQELDASDAERRRQPNRIHLELAVPADQAQIRLATMLTAGGRLLDESGHHLRVADPEDNVLVVVTGP